MFLEITLVTRRFTHFFQAEKDLTISEECLFFFFKKKTLLHRKFAIRIIEGSDTSNFLISFVANAKTVRKISIF